MTFIWKTSILSYKHDDNTRTPILCFVRHEIPKNNFFICKLFLQVSNFFWNALKNFNVLDVTQFKKTLCKEAQYIKGICIPNVRSCQRFSFNNSMSFELCVTWGVYSISFFHWNGIFQVLVLENNGWIQWIEGGKMASYYNINP